LEQSVRFTCGGVPIFDMQATSYLWIVHVRDQYQARAPMSPELDVSIPTRATIVMAACGTMDAKQITVQVTN